MPKTSHVRLVAPERNGGIRIRRRGYSFADGLGSVHGHLHAGLFFLAYMADPAQFVGVAVGGTGVTVAPVRSPGKPRTESDLGHRR